MARQKNKSKKIKGASLTKVLPIGIAVVFFWRGAWGLMDLYLFPGNPAVSSISSLFLGLGILYITHYLSKELIGE